MSRLRLVFLGALSAITLGQEKQVAEDQSSGRAKERPCDVVFVGLDTLHSRDGLRGLVRIAEGAWRGFREYQLEPTVRELLDHWRANRKRILRSSGGNLKAALADAIENGDIDDPPTSKQRDRIEFQLVIDHVKSECEGRGFLLHLAARVRARQSKATLWTRILETMAERDVSDEVRTALAGSLSRFSGTLSLRDGRITLRSSRGEATINPVSRLTDEPAVVELRSGGELQGFALIQVKSPCNKGGDDNNGNRNPERPSKR